jgi:hypothetical protein
MARRKSNGQFMPGKSGNPNGRPATESAAIRKQLAANYEAIIQAVRSAALGGDMQACKMILERICPPLKAQGAPVIINLPPEGDMIQIAEALIRAAAEGSLAPDTAAQMVSAVGQLARITEIKEDLSKSEDECELVEKIEIIIIDSDGVKRDLV